MLVERLRTLAVHTGFRRYASNASWLMGERVFRMFIGLFVGIWVARYLGPDQFGLLSYAQSLVFLFIAISTLGLDAIVVRELVNRPHRRSVLLGSAFVMKIIGALCILPLLALALALTDSDQNTAILVFVIAAGPVFHAFNVIDFFFQSRVLSRYVAWANFMAFSVGSLAKVGLILLEGPLLAFAVVIALEAMLVAMGLVWFYWQTDGGMRQWRYDRATAMSLLRDSWPLILSGIVVAAHIKIDQVMIKEMLNTEAVGHYAAAAKLSEAWYFIPMAVANSLFPAILNARNTSQALYEGRLLRLYSLMIWVAIALAVPTTLVANWVIVLLFGEAYAPAGPVLMIHIWAGVFVFLGTAFGKYLASENLVIKSFYRNGLGTVSNIGINFLLIPLHGIVGAAVATLGSQVVANYLYDFFDRSLWRQLYLKTLAFSPHVLIRAFLQAWRNV